MSNATRRNFLQQTGLGLAGLGVGGLVLQVNRQPTLATVSGDDANRILIQMGAITKEAVPAPDPMKLITPVSYGPFYKRGAPFRAKLSTPGEPGTTFVLSGRAWAFDTKRPLPGVVLDFWHVDMNEKYSNGVTDFRNRGRLISNETGYYEVECIRPIPYRPNPSNLNFWRCAHFHMLAVCPGYKPLVTEIHFKDDPKMADPMYRPENAIAVVKKIINGASFETGVFDVVLERETAAQ